MIELEATGEAAADKSSGLSVPFALLARNSKVKRALVAYCRIACASTQKHQVELSQGWWQAAFLALFVLFAADSRRFVLSVSRVDGFTLEQLQGVRVGLSQNALMTAQVSRETMLAQLDTLVTRAISGHHKREVRLAIVGQDAGVRSVLRGMSLKRAIQALCSETGRFEIDKHPAPVDWVIRFKDGWSPARPKGQDSIVQQVADTQSVDGVESGNPIVVLAVGDGVVLVEKPSGVSTEALLWSTAEAVTHEYGSGVALPSVSRLDRPTSGVIAIPTHPAGEACLTAQYKSRTAEKTYLCLVCGKTEPEGVVDRKLYVSQDKNHWRVYVSPKGKPAVTQYRRISLLRRDEMVFSLLRVKPLTGRTHQIRAHLSHLGYPLVSDTKYKRKLAKRQLEWCPRLFLHALSLTVNDANGVAISASARLPDDLQSALDCMEEVTGQ